MGWIYLLFINVLTFCVFGADKRAAIRDRRRVRESTLLGLCLIGGSIGGLTAMYAFHHKTRKAVFSVGIPLMIAAQVLFILICSSMVLK